MIMADQEQQPKLGLECPRCGCNHFETDDEKQIAGGRIRRYRACRNCGRRLVTIEIEEDNQVRNFVKRIWRRIF
jgi:transcriptional regulator NrdR family protein